MSVTSGRAQAAEPLVGGNPVPELPDLDRLRSDRSSRLRDALQAQGYDALLLIGTSAVNYATGAAMPSVDHGRATLMRPVALVLTDDPVPHLFTPYPDGAVGRLPDDHVHPPLYVDLDESTGAIAAMLDELVGPGRRLAADELTTPIEAVLDGQPGNGATILAAARIVKTPDELACIRHAQRLNEAAMADVYPLVRPGVRQCDLSAALTRRAFELGASGIGVDPIWQVMPERKADGPWTVHGDVAYPTPTTDRILRDGDVLWVDSGLVYEGYASDFGRTWIVGRPPTDRQEAQFLRWWEVMEATLDVVSPGATGGELCRAARAAGLTGKPWLEHFYLVHGVGVDPAEMPLLGTDLGEELDESIVLAPGMVLVLEPVIWDEGAAGYRAEDIVAVTDTGWTPLSDHTYAPFASPAPGARAR